MGFIGAVKNAMRPYREVWYPAFLVWFKQSHEDGEQRWKDKAFDPDYIAQSKKSFKAGWNAAVREAQKRVREDANKGTMITEHQSVQMVKR